VALPDFLVKKIPKQENIKRVRALLDDPSLHTVCESASCPNIGECFSKNTLTFMILGNICTRQCRFCGVEKGTPLPADPEEPRRIAEAVKKLGLNYVVITSVTRDDLPDGGARQFARAIHTLRQANPAIQIEVLIPDFKGDLNALQIILEALPDVLNHNLETVPRLYPAIRPQADYLRSLELISRAKALKKEVYTKSGFMVGLGEAESEVIALQVDLKSAGCDVVTVGQYLPPSKDHPPVERYVDPKEFVEYQKIGQRLGFKKIICGPFVRSSYLAAEILCKKHSDY